MKKLNTGWLEQKKTVRKSTMVNQENIAFRMYKNIVGAIIYSLI